MTLQLNLWSSTVAHPTFQQQFLVTHGVHIMVISFPVKASEFSVESKKNSVLLGSFTNFWPYRSIITGGPHGLDWICYMWSCICWSKVLEGSLAKHFIILISKLNSEAITLKKITIKYFADDYQIPENYWLNVDGCR